MNQVPGTVFPVDAAGAGHEVKVSYPAMADADSPYRSIVARGNIPLLIGDCVLAEVPSSRLDSEWQASAGLSNAQASDYCRRAAARLSRALDSGIAAADLGDVVANAAVLFVLSLREAGIVSPGDIRPCTVRYDSSSRSGRVNRAS